MHISLARLVARNSCQKPAQQTEKEHYAKLVALHNLLTYVHYAKLVALLYATYHTAGGQLHSLYT
jgi:hypothetical protein